MDWRFSTFLLFLFALLIGFSWGTSQDGLCNTDYVRGVLADRTKDGAYSCFEFWLNRYQSLIGAMIAVLAAALAWRGVKMQVSTADAQAKISRRQTSIYLIEVLNIRAKEVSSLHFDVMMIAIFHNIQAANFEKMLEALQEMSDSADNPEDFNEIYVNKFEPFFKIFHMKMDNMHEEINACRKKIENVLLSNQVKKEIYSYVSIFSAFAVDFGYADKTLSKIIHVFDMSFKDRKRQVDAYKNNLMRYNFKFEFHLHAGWKAIDRAKTNYDSLIDAALEDAEGQLLGSHSKISLNEDSIIENNK